MINFQRWWKIMENGESFKINHNSNLPYIPDHPFRILIIDGSGSGKSNVYLLNLLKYQWSDIDKNLFICQRSIHIKVSITYQWKGKNRNEKLQKSESIYRLFTNHKWWRYWLIDYIYEPCQNITQQGQKKDVNSFWWHDNRYGI